MTYKIVKIVDEYMVVVNYGKEHNAEAGDILEIFQKGEEIFDPDNGENLGTLDIIKARIKVVNVYEKMSLCKSNEFTKINTNLSDALNRSINAFSTTFSRTEIQALNINTKQVSGGYYEGEKKTVNLSDPVKVIKSLYEERLKEEQDIEEY